MTKVEFLKRALNVHNLEYNYENIPNVFKYKDKLNIICKKHGIFQQYCYVHLRGSGCNDCGNTKIGNSKKVSNEKFIQKCNILHDNKYEYNNVKYENSNTLIKVFCKKHGYFTIKTSKHLEGLGCKKCIEEANLTKRKLDFIENANKIHNYKYTYSDIQYINQFTHINIICPIHGIFKQTPKQHIKGSGCVKCFEDKKGWSLSFWRKRATNNKITFYIIKCWNKDEVFYKFGITTISIKNRFKYKIPYNYKIVRILSGDVAYMYYKELHFKKLLNQFKYQPKLKFNGITECFKLNIT